MNSGLEREGHAHFADSDVVPHVQIAQRLHQIVIGFAGAQDANARRRAIVLVQPIQPRERARRFQTPDVRFRFKHQRDRRNQPRIGALFIAVRNANGRPLRIHVHGAAAIAYVRHHLHPHPRARKPRHRDRHQSVIQNLLRIAGIQKRNAEVVQAEVALMRDGGALRNVIVAAQHQRRAIFSRARQVRVPKHVARPVDARPFAVPDADHALHLALSQHAVDLAAHHRRSCQIFVHPRPEVDVVLAQDLAGARERHVIATQRRAFVTGDERARAHARALVPAHLIDRQANQRLNAGQIHSSAFDRVFFRELHRAGAT